MSAKEWRDYSHIKIALNFTDIPYKGGTSGKL